MVKSKTAAKTPVSSRNGRVKNVADAGRKAAATRVRLLDAAAKVLADKGFNGMRLSDVGDVAGVRAPAIYYHFSDKEELAAEVFISGFAHSRLTLEAALEQHVVNDALNRLAVAIEAYLRMTARHSDYGRAASHRVTSDVPATVMEKCRSSEKAYASVWTRLLNDASEEGLLRDGIDLKIAQSMLTGSLNAITNSWRSVRSPAVDHAVSCAQRILLSGLSGEDRDWSAL